MARGTQFSILVQMLRSELRRSTNVAVGSDDLFSLKQTLTRNQEILYDAYDWPHLRQLSSRIALTVGQQFYDVPSNFNFDRVERGVTIYASRPFDLVRGIDFENYATYDSYASPAVTADPAQRWDIRWTGTKEQIEIWPIPASSTATAQWRGIRKLRAMVNDSDPCDLDDQLIVLYSAAELLGAQGAKDAGAKAKLAEDRLIKLKGNSKATQPTTKIGLNDNPNTVAGRVVVRVR
jgi:hypothetical protein